MERYGFGWEPAFDETVEPSKLRSVAVADPNDASTFARVDSDGARRAIAVTQYQAGIVRGVDLSVLLERDVADLLGMLANRPRVQDW